MFRKLVTLSLFISLMAALLAVPTAAGSSNEEKIYREFIAAVNRGDVDAAVALMTDDVQLQGTPGCLAPCLGIEAVRADLGQDAAGHLQIQLLGSVSVSGDTLKSNTAHRADILANFGLSRVIIDETITFEDGKISSVVFAPRVTDRQTAELVMILTAGPQPAIQPPTTGDGGLAAATPGG